MIVRLRSYQAFCVAIESGSISAAARRLYLSQPTVTERIVELERSAGVPLLERSKRGVAPTSEGQTLYERARHMLSEVEVLETTLESTLRELRDSNDLRLRFAAGVVCGEYLLPKWLWRFERTAPGVIPDIFMGSDPEVVVKVESGEFPLGIVADEGCHDVFDVVPICRDELIVVVRSGHPWAGQQISAEELKNEPFIAKEPGSSMRTFTDRAINELGVTELEAHLELHNLTAMKQAVEAGLGFSILPRAALQKKLETGALVEVEGFSVPWKFKLIRNCSVSLSTAEERFRRFLVGGSATVGEAGAPKADR